MGTGMGNWNCEGGMRNWGLRQQAMGFFGKGDWGIVDGVTRSPQRRFALLRVDIEIVWVLRCFFFFVLFVVDFYAAIRHKYFLSTQCVCVSATACVCV